MTQSRIGTAAALAGVALLTGANAAAADSAHARLTSFEEVPAVSSLAGGTVEVTLKNQSIVYRLRYDNLGSQVTQAHIHLAQRSVNGGVMVFLCSNLGNGPAGTPACPGTTNGTVTGTIAAAGVVGPGNQGIAAGEFAAVLRAIRAGVAYANVHTTVFPGGEIRGQLQFTP